MGIFIYRSVSICFGSQVTSFRLKDGGCMNKVHHLCPLLKIPIASPPSPSQHRLHDSVKPFTQQSELASAEGTQLAREREWGRRRMHLRTSDFNWTSHPVCPPQLTSCFLFGLGELHHLAG